MPTYSEKAGKYLQMLFEKNVCHFALKNKLATAENIKRISDLLFYHLKLRSYVVIELKKGDFKP